MTKRLFTLAIMSILALSAWADETSWTWNFTDNNTWTTAKIVTGSDVTLNTGGTTPGNGEYGVTFNFVSDKASITSSGLGYLNASLDNTNVATSNYVSIEIPVGFQATFNFTSPATSGRAIYYTTDGSNTQTNISSNIIVYRNEGENPVTLKVWAKNPVKNSASQNIISSIVLEYLSNITYHRWTVNAIIKNTDTQIDTWTKDEIAEGSEFTAYLKKVIKYNEQYYELADDTYTGLFIQDTMNEDKVYSVNYQLSDDIIFFKEGEDITQSTVSETASGGAFCGYIGRPIAASAITIPNAGYYKAEALVMETRKSPVLTFWNGTDNYSNNNSAVGITIGDGIAGLNYSDKFQVNSSTTYYIGGTAKEGENAGYNNSLAFDYILIRRLSDPTVENLAAATPTYNGSAQNLVTTPTVTGGSIKYSTTQDGTYTEAIPQGTNVGDYSVWYKVTGDATHSDIAATQVPSVSITQATNTLSGTLSIEDWTYGSAANSPSGVTAAFGDVAYKYSDAVDGTYGTYEEKVNGAVGTWWVKAYVDGTDNYTAVESDAVSFTISPATPVNPTLTVTQPSKGGTIAADHSGEVASGTQVTITVTPTDGYQIKSGTLKYTYNDGEDHEVAIDENTKTFSMPAYNINVTAEFEPITFTISYYGLEGANLGGMNPENYTVETDDFTLINPTKDNAEFAGWTGTELNAASTSVTISKGSTGNREYTATWTDSTPTSYTLTPTVSGNGEIHVVANNTTTKIDSATEYDAGTQVQLVAVPNDGYQLSTWSGDLANNDIPSSIWLNAKNMTSNVNLTATFVAQPETVESISESRSWTFGSFAAGTKLSGTKTYHYNGLYICGHNQNHQNLAGIETAGSNSVAFEDGPTVNYQNYLWLAGGQSPNNAGAEPNVFVRDYVAFKVAVPGTVYVYMGGKTNNYCRIYSGGTLKTTDTALTSDNTPGQYKASVAAGEVVRIGTNSGAAYIYAIAFVPASYTFKATSGSNGSITVMKGEDDVTEAVATEGGSTYNYGTSFTLTATANDGYHFVNWTDGEESVISISNLYTISSLSANTTLKANFEADAHVHNFNYAVGTGENTNILTATCQNTGCGLTESKATLTLTADGGTYNGSAFSASTNLDVFNSATGLGATVSINYTGDNLYNSTDAPTNSGSYTATATVTIGGTDYILTKAFSISSVSDPTFNIQLPELDNGNNVLASHAYATAGTEITLTIVTATNYCLSSISVNNGVNLSGSGTTRTFIMPAADVTISATFTEITSENVDKQVTENVTVDNSNHATVTSVEVGASTTSVTISGTVSGAQVTSIEESAFSNVENKDGIKSVDLSATAITGVEVDRSNGVFKGFPEETMIYMPAGNTEASGQKNVIIGGTCSDFVMTDEKSYNIPTSFTAMSATLSRSFTSDVTCTLCLPYAIPAATIASFGKIYYFSGINGTTIQMTEQTGDLEANTPYIFVPNNAATGITTTGSISVSMSDAETHNNTAKFTFKGVYEHKVFSSTEISSGVYGFAADADHGAASVGQFVKASNGAWTEGMRAYLEYSEGDLTGTASTRGEGLPDVLNVVLIHANGSTTNIGRLELMTAEDGSPVYNLNGQRVDNSYKGIVIKNGKKVIKK